MNREKIKKPKAELSAQAACSAVKWKTEKHNVNFLSCLFSSKMKISKT